MAKPADLTTRILQRIQEELVQMRKELVGFRKESREGMDAISHDLQELVSRTGQGQEELEARVRRIEEHLNLQS
jgi:hypothetical protein